MQRKLKHVPRSRRTAGKPARNRRSAEQMLVELKQRLREISDLNAAADVLNWDQATYMPEGGAGARGRQRAMLNRLAHERVVEPALGRLIDALARYGESLPHDSDDASLIRVARREYQKRSRYRRTMLLAQARTAPHRMTHGGGRGRPTISRRWYLISNGRWTLAANILPIFRPTNTPPIRTLTMQTRV